MIEGIDKLKIMAVIPARGGSKGVPGKNLRLIMDKPLISYMINYAKTSKYISKIIVSTDDENIASAARDYGAEAPFLRPKEMAQDTSPLNPALKHALEFYDSNGWESDAVISLQPTSPLITVEIIDAVIELFFQSGCDSVATVSEIKHGHPYRAKKILEDKRLENFCNEFDGETFFNRQERPSAYAYNGAIYMRTRDLVKHWDGKDMGMGKDCRGYLIDHEYAVNIDDEFDFRLAQILLKERFNENSTM
ncbi:MAG: acylneuraminate cytidylyltransferase family protein [Pseudomonadota bacterium]